MTSSYYFGHLRPPRSGQCPSDVATRFLAVRARGAHPDRLKPRPASPFRKGDLVELHLEKGEPQGHVVDVKTCPRTGEAINFKVDLGKGRLVWRGVAALKTP